MTLIQIQTDLLHALPLHFPAFLEFTLLGILERGNMDFLSQLELKDNYVRPVFESPDNLNISLYMTCTNTFEERFVSFSYVPPSFCPVLVRFLSISCSVVSVHWPLIDLHLSDICAIMVRFVRSILRSWEPRPATEDDVHHRIIFFSNVYRDASKRSKPRTSRMRGSRVSQVFS